MSFSPASRPRVDKQKPCFAKAPLDYVTLDETGKDGRSATPAAARPPMLLRVTVAGGVLKALHAPTSSAMATTRFVIITTRRQSTDDSLERCVLVC